MVSSISGESPTADRTTLVDSFGRRVNYLRVSVTDRCNFRCTYCLPEEGYEHLPRPALLTYEEIELIVRLFAERGVRKVRLTGGEPLVRAELHRLVAALSAIEGLDEVALTTNAFLLARQATALAEAGLDSLNISIDSLRPERFEKLTRVGSLARVIEGIDAALAAGIERTKLNAVVIRGCNDDELVDLVEFAAARDVVMRFIEFMPIGQDTLWTKSDRPCVTARQMRERLSRRWDLVPDTTQYGAGPARYWRALGRGLPAAGHPIGFISAVTNCFCADCNRVRITPEGGLRACLADDAEISLRDPLRLAPDPASARDAVVERIEGALLRKKERHSFDISEGAVTIRQMTSIGG